jgi:hypothetical protein
MLTTPGAWVEIDPSLSVASGGVTIALSSATSTSGASSSTLMQIGTGAGGAEAVWATFSIGNAAAGLLLTIPGLIAAGTRVSVRVVSAAETLKAVSASYSFLPNAGLAAPVSYGTSTATAQGVSLTYSGSINTWSGWTTITASTSADIDALAVFVQMGGDTTAGNGSILVGIGVGAAASEVSVASFALTCGDTEFFRQRQLMTVAASIPSGSRISARFATSIAATNLVDVAVVGAALP